MKNQKYSGIEYGDNNDELLSEMSIEYDKSEDVWVKPLVEKQEVFEKSSNSNCISYATEYEYDDDYNVIKLSQLENDIVKIIAEFTYIDIDDKKIYGLPETIIVKSPSGEILRKRSGEYNDKGLLTMKKKIIYLLFCILSNIAILYIIVLNSIQLYSAHSKKSLLDLIYSIFALIIFIRFELILLKKE